MLQRYFDLLQNLDVSAVLNLAGEKEVVRPVYLFAVVVSTKSIMAVMSFDNCERVFYQAQGKQGCYFFMFLFCGHGEFQVI